MAIPAGCHSPSDKQFDTRVLVVLTKDTGSGLNDVMLGLIFHGKLEIIEALFTIEIVYVGVLYSLFSICYLRVIIYISTGENVMEW